MKRDPSFKYTCRSLTLVLAMACCFVAGHRADGFSYFQVGGINVVWQGGLSVRYLSPSTFPIDSGPDIHYLASMGLWNLVPAADFEYQYIHADQDFPIDNFDGFNDTAAVSASELDPGVLGVTFLVNQGSVWFDMDMVFSDVPEGIGWYFIDNPPCDMVAQPTPINGFSFLLVAVHELGHALGLGHDPIGDESPGTPWFIATMNPRYPSGGATGQENIVELHADDQSGLRFLYPHAGPSEPPHVDLATAAFTSSTTLGKAVPSFFTPSAVYPGDTLTVRSVIENLGSTNEFMVAQGFYLSDDQMIEDSDMFLGELLWDIPFQDAFEFDVDVDMPEDLPAGDYIVGTILDRQNEIAEVYEDNNALSYCDLLTINQLVPVINNIPQESTACGTPYTGPTPVVTHPLNMAALTWSIDNPQPGMTINPSTGVVSWPDPIRSEFPYVIFLRATNSAGSSTQSLFLGVSSAEPDVLSVATQTAHCGVPFDGPIPAISNPACMDPIINWSLDFGPGGMSIDFNTGQVHWNDPQIGGPYSVTIRATNAMGNGTQTFDVNVVASADRDGDADVDLEDYAEVNACIAGPDLSATGGCECVDLDGDGDVDLADAAEFQLLFTGSITGACCLPNGTCVEESPILCAADAGVYRGDETTCTADACEGACCLPNGFCLDLSESNCNGASGTFEGIGTDCGQTSCPSP
ncbi:MAG TPA: matrixin family metalloprotease [Phycisphaerae bacterium]|nr:matrixin family metalloprotease [Phycisphaerae bacterium]